MDIKDYLKYDQNTGNFHWLLAPSNSIRVGSVAGCRNEVGYIRIQVCGKQYYAHVLAWLFMTGTWPECEVDHISTNKSDNRWRNLRAATESQNRMNQGLRSNNSSGYKGVSWNKAAQKWCARCKVNLKEHLLGYFDDPVEAASAYQAFAKIHHGEFYRAC